MTTTPTTNQAVRLLGNRSLLRVGRRFGKLTVLGHTFYVRSSQRYAMCVCRCECGEYVATRVNRLLAGTAKSCGCQRGGPSVAKVRKSCGNAQWPADLPADLPTDDLATFFETHYRPLKLRSRSHNTVRLYRYSIKCFGQTLGRRAGLTDFTDEAVSQHLARLIGDGYSPYSVNKERSQLLAIWNFAARKKHVDRFPDVEAERCPTRVPQAWLEREMAALFQACQAESGSVSGVPARDWWAALLLVIWDTAERIGAVRQLQWEHLDTAGWLLIPAELRKGKREDKHFHLGADTRAALESIRQPERSLIFPWPFSDTLIYSRYKRILRRAGLPTDYRSMFHRLRRTVASFYEARGGDATDLLGHTNRATTKRYLDPRIVPTKQPCDLVFRLPSQASDGKGEP